jgi:3-hydroxyisobutyrate dehydrogenase
MTRKIGFVGLGMMGLPMVENLATAAPELDATLLAFDTADAPFGVLAGNPSWGRQLDRAATLAALTNCEIVITMLPNSAITIQVLDALRGVLARGAIIIDMGSSDPAETQRQALVLAEANIALVDAPVSGAVAKARAGTLAIMAGGDDAAVDAVRPLLESMGSALIRTGAVGSAHAMKSLNNYVYAAGLLATSEAVLIAQSMGLDLEVLADVLNASSGRNVATETKLRQFILPRTFNAGFALRLQAKDLATASSLQALADVDAPQLSLCARLWEEAAKAMPQQADNTEIARFLEIRAPV